MYRMTCDCWSSALLMEVGLIENGPDDVKSWGLRVNGSTSADREDITSCRPL